MVGIPPTSEKNKHLTYLRIKHTAQNETKDEYINPHCDIAIKSYILPP